MSDKKYFTRMGDGEAVLMTKEEIREDVNTTGREMCGNCKT
ncbi:hypothetical protein [Zhenpiania hominis]